MKSKISLWTLGAVLTAVVTMSLACAQVEPTPTPVPPAQPAAPVAPVAAPQPTAVLILGEPTPIPARVAPTRVLPTATQVTADGPKYGGVLRVSLSHGFDTMDPAYQNDVAFRRVNHNIYNSLVQLTAEGGIGPDLAKSWDFSNDGTVITFHLQEGVKFHDGTVLDAQAIKWNFDRYLDEAVASPRRAELAPPLERVEVLDSRTLVFHLSAAFRPFLTVITDQAGWMASPTAVKELNSYDDYNGEFGSHPVGTGPFKFEGWLPGRRVRLVSNDNYWEKGKPYLDGIDLPYAEDQQVAFAMARTGNLDVMEYMIAVDVPKAANNQNIDIVSLKAVRTSMMFINITAEPWDNKALRQAFSYAIDREAGVKVLYDGLGNPGYHLPSGAGIWANPEFKMYKYDLQKAKEKLAEAGYANGFTYDQECRASTAELRRCEVLQSMVAKAGITMNIQPHESSTYFWDWYNGHYGTAWMFQSWRVDPHRNMVRQYGCGNFIAKGLHYCNSEVDSLLEEAAKTYDVPKARALYDRAERIIMEAAPVVTFIAEDAYYAINNRVQGLGIPPDQVPRVRNVWLLR